MIEYDMILYDMICDIIYEMIYDLIDMIDMMI